jgi:hypothetical protein
LPRLSTLAAYVRMRCNLHEPPGDPHAESRVHACVSGRLATCTSQPSMLKRLRALGSTPVDAQAGTGKRREGSALARVSAALAPRWHGSWKAA